ncbi:MAG: tRNA lysidine(34) synthetase TilS [Gammaproteobacteria bacterium RIFCSPHIGHO2_02_FULL_42_13]|nr:MAG: tRNA lysidine(34) synthetase TilS [Gammaproteobacteria bacterium RIFCSPHIGHO2_02_FULL_42_13]OGT67939.1 MAG: tRNA lysidine(34) synthetase TilS [Gammaproteobacteria bacterium RIFCSPLOWO2_02_FULL_42_9]
MFDELNNLLQKYPNHVTIWIAYSGGVDSHVLLHAVCEWRKQYLNRTIHAVHVHHGLQADADKWVTHCDQVCQALQVGCTILYVDIEKTAKQSMEAEARKARYNALATLMQAGDVLLTAQHQDDQAETCLLQFLRGAGARGLAAMPQIMPFSRGYLVRPLISISKQEILDYAKEHQLRWVEDSTNLDEQFTRNFLRARIMPLLKSRWPNVPETIARVAAHSAETKNLLEDLAQTDLQQVKSEYGLSVQRLRALSCARQKNLLRYWFYQQDYLLPSTIKLQHIINDVVMAREDATPCVQWSDVEVRRFGDDLYVMPVRDRHDVSVEYSWDGVEPLHVKTGVLICQGARRNMTVRFRRGGEVCRLRGRTGTHELKKLFQEWQVPPWERDRVPLIFVDGQLAAIVGCAVCEGYEELSFQWT